MIDTPVALKVRLGNQVGDNPITIFEKSGLQAVLILITADKTVTVPYTLSHADQDTASGSGCQTAGKKESPAEAGLS